MASNLILPVKEQYTTEAFLYPAWNTLKFDGKTLDGRPFERGVNLPGPRIPQYFWDTEKDRNCLTPAFYIEPNARLKNAKQEQFYQRIFDSNEVFMAGSRGTAKTYALLKSHVLKRMSWKARGITGQNTAMFAKTKDALIQRHVSEFANVYPSWVGEYSATDMAFHFSEKYLGGGVMFLLYAGQPDEQIKRLLSLNLPYVTFEELTELSEIQYLWVTSSMRSTQVPEDEWCVGSASNAGGKGHKWVNDRFVKPKQRKEANARGERRVLIKSFPYENPALPRTYWDKQLAKLPPKLRKQWIDNDWTIYEGQYFDMIDENIHFLPKRPPRDEVVKYLAIDHGSGAHPTGCVLVEHYPPTDEHPKGKRIVVMYYELKDKFSSRHKTNIWRMLGYNADGSPIVLGHEVKNIQWPSFLSHDAWASRASTDGDLFVNERYNEDDSFGRGMQCIRTDKSPGSRAMGWLALSDLSCFEYHWEEREEEQVDGSFLKVRERKIDRPPQLYFLRTPEIAQGVDELTAMIHSDIDTRDAIRVGANEYDEYEGDEFCDALRYCIMGMDRGGIIQSANDQSPYIYNPMDLLRKEDEQEITMGDFFA